LLPVNGAETFRSFVENEVVVALNSGLVGGLVAVVQEKHFFMLNVAMS